MTIYQKLVLFVIFSALAVGYIKTSDASTVIKAPDENLIVPAGTGDISPFNTVATEGYRIMRGDNDIYHVYLGVEIVDIYAYTDLIRGLKELALGDIVILHMANYGGSVHSGVQIINAMKASFAKVIVEVEGPSYSMGALISCAADQVLMHPYTYLMFHHYSGTLSGKGAETRAIIDALDELSVNLMRRECLSKGILTEDQIQQIINGVDIYVHPHLITIDN